MPYEKECYEWAKALCECAGEDEAFLAQFWEKLIASPPIYAEFLYYLANHNFACQTKIEGTTVVDIMVWQIDRFKTNLDKGEFEMKENGDRMLLLAFDTFLEMEKDPMKYLDMLHHDTGTDYFDKY